MSTDPQVSAPQCTIPDAKSAVTIPRTGGHRYRGEKKEITYAVIRCVGNTQKHNFIKELQKPHVD